MEVHRRSMRHTEISQTEKEEGERRRRIGLQKKKKKKKKDFEGSPAFYVRLYVCLYDMYVCMICM